MAFQSMPAIILASIAIYSGIYHLLVYVRRPVPRYHLSFGLTCLAVGLYDIFSACLYNVSDVPTGVGWLHLISLAGAIGAVFFLHFVSDYTERRDTWFVRSVSLGFLPIIALSMVKIDGWLWTSQPLVKSIQLPFNIDVTYYETVEGPFTTYHSIMNLLVLAYAFWAGIQLFQAGNRQKATPLLVALSIFSVGILNDTAVTSGIYEFIYLTEYAYLAMILLMTYSLASEAHKSAEMEETLRESRRQLGEANYMLQLVLDTIPVRVFWKDRDSVYLGCNRLFAKDAGRVIPAELIGEDDFAMGWRNEAEMYRADDRSVIESGHPQINYEETQTTPWGDKIWLRTSKMPLRDTENKVIGVLGTYEDITERKRQEEALRQSEENLTITLNSIGDGVIATDAEGRITRMNPVAEQLTGWSAIEAAGHSLAEVLHLVDPDTHEKVEPPAEFVMREKGKAGFESRRILVGKDGTERLIAESTAPLRDLEEKILGVVLVLRDVTEEHALQQLVHHSQKMEAIGQLAGGVAHDFNNLLQAIQGYAETALSQLSANHPIEMDLKEVIKATEKAAALTRQLLAFGRRGTLQRKHLNLNLVVDELTKMLRRVIGEHVELKVQTGQDLKPISADPAQIEQILVNLCINARDAMPDGGLLTIATCNVHFDPTERQRHPWAQADDYVLLTVTDTGRGISSEVKERVFEPFFTTKKVGGGTGLGLAVVYAIVERHEGMIELESEVGRGTNFRIFLPASQAEPTEAATPETKIAPEVKGGSETILVAEDDPVVRDLTMQILERAGYRLIVAKDGAEASDLFVRHAQEIDLVILDVIMPKKSGREVHDIVKEFRPELPVLFHSGYSYDVIGKEHLPEDVYHLIQKPYLPRDLLHQIRLLLREYRA